MSENKMEQLRDKIAALWQQALWPSELQEKCRLLEVWLAKQPACLVALSGGQDSAFMLIAAILFCERTRAVTIDSALLPFGELADSKTLCRDLGVEHQVLLLDPLSIDAVRSNRSDRCYHCKMHLFTRIKEQAECSAVVLDGTNADDENDFRPGKRALQELGVHSPLLAAGFSKRDIAAGLRILGMGARIKPASACLATRFPYDTELNTEKLVAVGQLEKQLRQWGFEQCRVRVDDLTARIEVAPEKMSALMAIKMRSAVVALVKDVGYRYVVLDLEGYRTGSWNQGRKTADLRR